MTQTPSLIPLFTTGSSRGWTIPFCSFLTWGSSLSHSLFFSCSFYFLASYPALGMSLKGVSRDFPFSWFKPIWAPDKQPKVFSNLVSISPRYSKTNWSLRCVAHRWDRLCVYRDHLPGVMNTGEMIFAVCCTQLRSSLGCIQRSSPWCDAHCTMHTREMISAVWCTPRRSLCYRISRRNRNRILKYFRLFIRGPDRFESWKK